MKNKYILISILILNMVPFAYAQSKKELKQIIQTQQEQLQEQNQRIETLINSQQDLSNQINDLKGQQEATLQKATTLEQQNTALTEEVEKLRVELEKQEAVKKAEEKRQAEIKQQEEKREAQQKAILAAYRKTFSNSQSRLKEFLSKESAEWEGLPTVQNIETAIMNTYNTRCNMGTVKSVDLVKWSSKNIPGSLLVEKSSRFSNCYTGGGCDIDTIKKTERKQLQISVECPDKKVYEAYLSPTLLAHTQVIDETYRYRNGKVSHFVDIKPR